MINYTRLNEYTGARLNHSYNEIMSFTDIELRDLLYKYKVLIIKNCINLTQIGRAHV